MGVHPAKITIFCLMDLDHVDIHNSLLFKKMIDFIIHKNELPEDNSKIENKFF